MNKKLLFSAAAVLLLGFFVVGFISIGSGHDGSKTIITPGTQNTVNPAPIVSDLPVIYTDDFDGNNDTTALKTRGYKVWYRGGGPQGATATWYQGQTVVFNAYNGPASGYVCANYSVVTGANNIDSWLVLPRLSGGLIAGDSLYFYERSATGSIYPDSIRVMYSVSDSVPEGTWVELGRFKTNTTTGWERKGFRAPTTSANGRFAVRYCVVDGGPSGSNSDYIGIDAMSIVRSAAPPTGGPDYLYYKFENNPNATTVLNCAIPGVGTASAPLGAGTPLSSGGQFDTCITGTGLGTGGVTTGYNFSPGTSSWTISMWITIPSTSSGSAYYLFGDAGNSFRCFHNGVALPDNLVLRGTGVTDVTVTGIGPTPTCVTFVYDSVAANVKAYKNGVLANTVSQTLNITGGTGFKVGGNSTSTSFVGKLDEFRMYHRALTAPEVLQAWNSDLSGCGIVGVQNNNNNTPSAYNLSQNYPNPFNPSTKISFALPKAGNVKMVVFDLLGREVATVVNEFRTAGNHTVDFNAASLASGVYFYKIEAGDFTATKKMLLIK
jgi:hypothetical protein